MKTLFKNAKVYLGRDEFADAVLVDGGKIAAAGGKAFVSAGADAKVIDCGGKTMIPAFSDSHMHLFGLALNLSQAKIADAKSVEDIVSRCRQFMNDHPERTGMGMYAAGWNQDLFTGEKRMPSKQDANAVSEEIPVCLERTCGHIVICNDRLLEMLEENGTVLTEEQKATGIFTEAEVKKPKDLITGYGARELAEMVLAAMERCASFGVTQVASNDAEFVFKDHDLVEDALKYIYDNDLAPIRYRQQISFGSPGEIEMDRFGRLTENEWYQAGPLKLFTDGSLGARSAHLRGGYADDPENHGIETMTYEEMEEYCRIAKSEGLQVVTHGIGDGAVEKIIDVYEKIFGPDDPLRCGIIHCQVTDDGLLERIASLGIPTLVQPIFLDYDIMIAEARCGKALAARSYAFRTLGRNGHMSFGTDCPVEDVDPFAGIYCAVTRKRKDGTPEGGWFPDECMDIYDAVDAYTAEPAYIAFAEGRRGRIKEGFDADLVLLDRDIFTVPSDEIKDIRPVLTMTGGRIVFEKQDL